MDLSQKGFLGMAYFVPWLSLYSTSTVMLFSNIRWNEIYSFKDTLAAVVTLVLQCALHIGLTERLTLSIVMVIIGVQPRDEHVSDCSNLTLILNYNVLALHVDDIEEAMGNMFEAFIGNMSENVSAVYLSATKEPFLVRYETYVRDRYRAKIYSLLKTEGEAYVNKRYNNIEPSRLTRLWRKLEKSSGSSYIQAHLSDICTYYSQKFMCIHRVSKVLKKCGQYQDLMLLSKGHFVAYTYTNKKMYGPGARPYGEPMFHDSPDVRNIHGKHFDYLLILDSDSKVSPGVAHQLLGVAASRPEKAILQPTIKLQYDTCGTIFMNLEQLRQELIHIPKQNITGRLFGQSGFFGKALIKISLYVDEVIGSPDCLLERVPIDVMSHDTYEGAILKPYHVGSVAILEKPSCNYLSWNNRQRRWNVGDVINGMYFHPTLLGTPIQALQRCFQGKRYFKPRLRTKVPLDYLTLYIADAPLYEVLTKSLWFLTVLMQGFLPPPVHVPSLPILFVVIETVMSKLALFIRCPRVIIYIIPELIASVFQYSPEVIAGCVRMCRVLWMIISGRFTWVPQRHIEERFSTMDAWQIFVSCINHLWGYALLAVIVLNTRDALHTSLALPLVLSHFDLGCILLLPLYCFITSFRI